ncbi:hypothetical protein [Thermoplasma volcanium GSS1]|uniref:Uncharacterized protein n=1 Tax=Thermoplasma volcanium (strain ATCC 51530 / DSM 4299 / JCM 9571 / NBRC 15438 / GSS1) TaxID=273116 RepID=Q97CI5_THEVO|nr:MoaD/ThiS family protein [Thermoplasma volcanium]BAB59258.1 hypothetical protein [Thermoplasma volcanium GSS1]
MITVKGHIKKSVEIDREMSVGDILKDLGLPEEEYVVIVNGKPVLADHTVKKDDDVVILEVFSGG